MIIWGSSTAKLRETYPVEIDCNVCNANNFILHGIQKYGHVWFLPLFPSTKIFFLTCEQCSGTLSFDSLDQLGERFEDMKFKTPKTSYLGWFIIGIIVLIVTIGAPSTKSSDPLNYSVKHETHNIVKNDFLILDSKEQKGYVIAKILDVTDGYYSLKFSKYVYKSKMTAENEVKRYGSVFEDDFYGSDYYDLSMKQIKDNFEVKDIVARKEHYNNG
jgi:hypothetical protein